MFVFFFKVCFYWHDRNYISIAKAFAAGLCTKSADFQLFDKQTKKKDNLSLIYIFPLPLIVCRPLRAGIHVPSIRPVQVPVALHLLAVSSAGAVQQAAAIHFPAVEETQQKQGGHLGRDPL